MRPTDIAKIELFKVPPRWLFVKITTADGLSGWGEPSLEGKAHTMIAAVEDMQRDLIGRDANRIEDIFQVLYRGSFYRGGPVLMSAISGIEQALWDLKGKRLGAPVYDLLGGAVREKVKIYTWIGGDQPRDVAAAALARVEAGYRAVKMNAVPKVGWLESAAQIDEIVDTVAQVRDAVGWDVGIGLDFHGRVRKAMAKILFREFEPLKPLFIEEPLLPENFDALPMIAAASPIPIATGERMYTRWGFKQLLEQRVVDIVQPDLSHAGGIWETRKIAAMAEAYDVAVAPHCPLGPIAFASSLQLQFCTPNGLIQESSMGIHYNAGEIDLLDYLENPEDFAVKDGYIQRNERPGLGVVINEEMVREQARIGHDWHNPVWRTDDGGLAEW
jgi:galactonate dehydratase